MNTKKGGEFEEKLAGESEVVGMENCDAKHNTFKNSQFYSNEIERLDENILFPPVKAVEIRDKIDQKSDGREDGREDGRMVNEYVDLSQIPPNLMKKFILYRPTTDIQVNKEDDSLSNSESDESEQVAEFSSNFDNLEFVDGFEAKNRNIKVNQSPTHFFCLAFNQYSCNLFKEFKALKKAVNESVEYGEIKPVYFIGEKKLHLTLGLVRIETPQELELCENALFKLKDTPEFQELMQESSSKEGFPVGLNGLGYFGSSYNTRVVYAKISESYKIAIIKRLWIRLSEILHSSGITISVSDNSHENSIKDQNLTDKIIQDYTPHVTFINTKYGSKGEKQRLTFNSSKLIRSYSKKNFGTGYISEIQLNELSGVQEIGVSSNEEQVYKTISSVKINGNE